MDIVEFIGTGVLGKYILSTAATIITSLGSPGSTNSTTWTSTTLTTRSYDILLLNNRYKEDQPCHYLK